MPAMFALPVSAIAISNSRRKMLTTLVTPVSPSAPKPLSVSFFELGDWLVERGELLPNPLWFKSRESVKGSYIADF